MQTRVQVVFVFIAELFIKRLFLARVSDVVFGMKATAQLSLVVTGRNGSQRVCSPRARKLISQPTDSVHRYPYATKLLRSYHQRHHHRHRYLLCHNLHHQLVLQQQRTYYPIK